MCCNTEVSLLHRTKAPRIFRADGNVIIDLLDHTPTTSPSRALVERAYEIALRIAKKCDRAQTHATFLRQQHQK